MRYSLDAGKRSALLAAVLGAFLALSFTGAPVVAQGSITAIGHSFAQSSAVTNTTFIGNATQFNATTITVNGTVSYNFLGTGGNDTFDLYGGNASGVFAATGVGLNNFSVISGNPGTAANSSIFSLISGDNSSFTIVQNNFNGSATFIIVGGANCFLNDSSVGPVNDTIFSVVLGTNSTSDIGAQFSGNQTIVNIVT